MKTVWITGASSGLGLEISKQAIKKGYRVINLARSFDEKITLEGNVVSMRLDLLESHKIEEQVTFLCESGFAPDVVINNAGIGTFAYADETEYEKTREIFNVNVLGTIAMTKAVIPFMKANKSGHIIQVGSQAGKLATAKASVYAASKHAVVGYTNAVRLELKPFHINVSTVNPGPIATPFLQSADPSGHYSKSIERWLLEPEKVAKRIVALIEKPKREVNLPWWMNIAVQVHAISPCLFEKLARPLLSKK